MFEEQNAGVIKLRLQANDDEMVIDGRMGRMDIGLLHGGNNHQPYIIPSSIIETLRPLQMLGEFVMAHEYDSGNIQMKKPILLGKKFEELVDPITYEVLSKYLPEERDEMISVVRLSNYLHFPQLNQAASAALLCCLPTSSHHNTLNQCINQYHSLVTRVCWAEKHSLYLSHLLPYLQRQ